MRNSEVEQLNRLAEIAEKERRNADQGQIFLAKFVDDTGKVKPRPVFIIGKSGDSNDSADVIVCKCTDEDKRSTYDLSLDGLKLSTWVRTNKIYTIPRSRLVHKITPKVEPAMRSSQATIAINTAQTAISLKQGGVTGK